MKDWLPAKDAWQEELADEYPGGRWYEASQVKEEPWFLAALSDMRMSCPLPNIGP